MKSIHTFYISILISLISLISASCNNKEFKETPPINISEVEDLVFPLDDSTVANMEYIQYFQRNDSNIFAFTNQYDNSILFYDYDSRKYLKRISFDKEGKNGIGNVFSFYYAGKDSIFHYHYNFRTAILTNEKGEVLDKDYIIVNPNPSPDSLFLAPTLFPRTNSPLKLLNGNLLIPGFLMAEAEGENDTNRPVMTYFDYKTKEIRHSVCYPQMYHKKNWGGDFTWRTPYYTLSSKNELVFSFSADHNIRVHSLFDDKYNEFYAGVGGDYEIEPFEETVVNFKPIDSEKLKRHYIENLSYGPIHWDKYRDVYYRIAMMPDSDININKRPIRKPIEIIVLDKNFNIIGKSPLKRDKYLINQCFVGLEGFHIQVQTENDDELRFKTFIIKDDKNK
ncbi:MAG: DUF4221 family protein [Bacteroides sp.]|nr:DUF4221 family protein [Bacteroides sp.]